MKNTILVPVPDGGLAATATAQTLPTVEMFKSPYCGCCGKWAEHLQKNGFKVISHETDNVPAKRKSLGMPDHLGSCQHGQESAITCLKDTSRLPISGAC